MTTVTLGGTTGVAIAPSALSSCTPELVSKEDLFLMYASYFCPPDINPTGFRHLYGVYDPSSGEVPNMCLGVQDRQALMRSLMLAYRRIANSLHYFPLPTYVTNESHEHPPLEMVRLRYGYIQTVSERECEEVEEDAPLVEDGDYYTVEVTVPDDAEIEDLVAYEPGTSVRIPIAKRELSGTTATLYFHLPTLVSASFWAECGAQRTSCDCSAEISDGTAFLTAVDVFAVAKVANSGADLGRQCNCTSSTTTVCARIDDRTLGWVRPVGSTASCACVYTPRAARQAPSERGAYHYTSGRWTISTLPDDMKEGILGLAIATLPETSFCQENMRPDHLRHYRELVPSELAGGMRPLGQTVARAAVMTWANGTGI